MYLSKKNEVIQLTAPVFQELFGVQEVSTLTFAEDDIYQKVLKKAEKKLSKERVRQTNQWALAMYKEEAKGPPLENLLIRLMNPLVGYGVYTLASIAAYTYVGEYAGVVKKRQRRGDKYNDYIFGYTIGSYRTPWVIDAKTHGNFTRFFNHSYTPNLTSSWMILDGVCHIIFFANRKIVPGEQLTYDYGPHFWKKRSCPITI